MSLRVSAGPHLLAKDSTRTLMVDVLIALAPTTAAGVYLFGLRAAWVLCVAVVSAVVSEYVWQRLMKRPVRVGDFSAIVTGLILGLNLSSTIALWVPALGSAIAIILIKELFGGIGNNFMNPAMFARAFLMASWPARMIQFALPERLLGASQAAVGVDTLATATPLMMPGNWTMYDMLLGNMPGTIGEVSKIAILIGFVYLLFVGTISWEIPVIFVGSTAALSWALGADPLAAVLSGGVLFGAVFMATDYATGPIYFPGKVMFAIGCGVMVVIIRQYGNYPEGVTFAILLMNCVTPLLDRFTVRRVYGTVKKHA